MEEFRQVRHALDPDTVGEEEGPVSPAYAETLANRATRFERWLNESRAEVIGEKDHVRALEQQLEEARHEKELVSAEAERWKKAVNDALEHEHQLRVQASNERKALEQAKVQEEQEFRKREEERVENLRRSIEQEAHKQVDGLEAKWRHAEAQIQDLEAKEAEDRAAAEQWKREATSALGIAKSKTGQAAMLDNKLSHWRALAVSLVHILQQDAVDLLGSGNLTLPEDKRDLLAVPADEELAEDTDDTLSIAKRVADSARHIHEEQVQARKAAMERAIQRAQAAARAEVEQLQRQREKEQDLEEVQPGVLRSPNFEEDLKRFDIPSMGS